MFLSSWLIFFNYYSCINFKIFFIKYYKYHIAKTYFENNYYFERQIYLILKMSQTPAYLTQTFEKQLLQLIKKMPDGEELTISKRGIKLRKNGTNRIYK